MNIEYNDKEKFLIGLTLISTYPNIKFNHLIENCENLNLDNLVEQKPLLTDILGEKTSREMQEINLKRLDNYIKNLHLQKIFCITSASEMYPKKLFEIEDYPIVLFCKGDATLLKTNSIAIVGTRIPSFYGKDVTSLFARELSKAGLTIISGLASGVDKISHEQALQNNGKTIAVLGGGFNHIYPAMNTNLAAEIEKKGLLLSEYRPSSTPTRYTFPARNRIIAALSQGVLLTEAGEKSGALHTKNFAQNIGRDLFAVPANINSEKGKGTNALLKNKEANFVSSPQDILDFYCVEAAKPSHQTQITFEETVIIDLLKDGERSMDELLDLSKLKTDQFYLSLTMLELQGKIRKQAGNIYTLAV